MVRRSVFGRSRNGQPLIAWFLGQPAARRRILVVGVIHGNEAAGYPAAVALTRLPAPTNCELVIVPDLNPDGVVHGTRQNADGVDLNRNFPYHWIHLGQRGDQQYSGTGPLSEPEARAIASLIGHVRPTISVWFHQPVGVIDESGGALPIEARFANAVGLPLRRLQRYPGSAVTWENETLVRVRAHV